MNSSLAIMMGLTLAAVCGLRAFLPLFIVSLLAMFGKLELGEAFQWLAQWPAVLTFGVAVVVETVADKIPVVDHALDSAGVVIKPIAASVVLASMVKDFDPLVALVLSLLTGGMLAEGIHLLKAKLRLLSTAFTGTIANPVLSLVEDIVAAVAAFLAWLMPLAGIVFMAVFIYLIYRIKRKKAANTGKT